MSLQTIEINSVKIIFDKKKQKSIARILINLVIVKIAEIITKIFKTILNLLSF